LNDKFVVDLRDYTVVKVECPDCHLHYNLRLRLDHSALFEKENNKIFVRCPDCAKASRSKH